MDIKNISLNEHLILKPLPPKILLCTICRADFTSYLKTSAEYYKTCNECRHKKDYKAGNTERIINHLYWI
jgi:hypothetical protein